jgi:hypothetical protein
VEKSTPPLILIDLRKYLTFWESAKSLHRPYLLWDGIYQTCSSYVDVYPINYHSTNSPRERGKKKDYTRFLLGSDISILVFDISTSI